MSGAFDDREDAFEKQFAKDEALRFRAVARRNKAVALWAAEMKGLAGEAAEKYAEDFVGAQVGAGDDGVAAALKQDLAHGDVDLSDNRLRKKMAEAMAEALEFGQGGQVRSKPIHRAAAWASGAKAAATVSYTFRLNGTTRSGSRSKRSQRQASNSAPCLPSAGKCTSISLS